MYDTILSTDEGILFVYREHIFIAKKIFLIFCYFHLLSLTINSEINHICNKEQSDVSRTKYNSFIKKCGGKSILSY